MLFQQVKGKIFRDERGGHVRRRLKWQKTRSSLHKAFCKDVDREQGHIAIQGNGPDARQVKPGEKGWRQLLLYLERYRLKATGRASDEVLFCSDTHQPLTPNAITQLFRRLRQ